jgi:hypothetical protein
MRRHKLILTVLACALFALPSLVRAQTTGAVGLEITPSQTELDLSGRLYQTNLTLFNHDPATYKVDLSLEALGHDLDGAPEYIPSSVVSKAFSLSSTSFSLAQGQKKQVTLKGAIPATAHSIYLGVIAAYTRPGQQAGSSVEIRTRLGSEFLLRGPKPWTERLQITDVGALPGKSATLYAIVKNLGNVHVRPTGTFTVSKAGRVIARFAFALNAAHKPGAVIPGFSRRYTASWTPPADLTGTFTVTAVTQDPAASGSKSVSFSNGKALAPDAKIANLSVQNSSGVLVDTQVTNKGTGLLTGAKLTLVATQDGRFERGRTVFPLASLAPGATVEKRWSAGTLPDGAYQITATLEQGTTLLDQRVAGVRVGAAPASGARTPLLAAAAVLLVLLTAGILWLVFFRRRSERDEPVESQTS